jgi:hypothetical protein
MHEKETRKQDSCVLVPECSRGHLSVAMKGGLRRRKVSDIKRAPTMWHRRRGSTPALQRGERRSDAVRRLTRHGHAPAGGLKLGRRFQESPDLPGWET